MQSPRGPDSGVVQDIELLRPMWHPDNATAMDDTRENECALFETLDEVYERFNIHKAIMIAQSDADAHVLCGYLTARCHAHSYYVSDDAMSKDIALNAFERGQTRVLVTTVETWWREQEFVCRHALYECDLVVYTGQSREQALDVRQWIETVCAGFEGRVRKPIRFLEAGPALFGWDVQWHHARRPWDSAAEDEVAA